MKNYYRLASGSGCHVRSCDRRIEEARRMENTLVIFTTDNGYFHAEHEFADKWYPYEESIRVPLIVRDPRMANEKHGPDSNANDSECRSGAHHTRGDEDRET